MSWWQREGSGLRERKLELRWELLALPFASVFPLPGRLFPDDLAAMSFPSGVCSDLPSERLCPPGCLHCLPQACTRSTAPSTGDNKHPSMKKQTCPVTPGSHQVQESSAACGLQVPPQAGPSWRLWPIAHLPQGQLWGIALPSISRHWRYSL